MARRQEIKKIARAGPGGYGLPFSDRSPAEPAEVPVAEGVVDDIGRGGPRMLLREERQPGTSKARASDRPRCRINWLGYQDSNLD